MNINWIYHRKSLSLETLPMYLCLWRRLDRTQTNRSTQTPRKEQSVIRRRSIFSPLQAAIATALQSTPVSHNNSYITFSAINIQHIYNKVCNINFLNKICYTQQSIPYTTISSIHTKTCYSYTVCVIFNSLCYTHSLIMFNSLSLYSSYV